MLDTLLAAVDTTDEDLELLFVLLALVSFAIAVYMAYLRNVPGALVAAFVGVVILLVT